MFDDFTLYLDLIKDCIEVYQNEEIVYCYNEPQNPNKMYLNEIEEFLNYLNNDIKSPISIAEGIKAQQLIDLIYKSSIDKKRIICE
jgi:predicted dehydrogenase